MYVQEDNVGERAAVAAKTKLQNCVDDKRFEISNRNEVLVIPSWLKSQSMCIPNCLESLKTET